MLRLIGFLVIVGLFYFGWGSLKGLWEGEISGRDATKEVVDKISNSLDKESSTESKPTANQNRSIESSKERQTSSGSAEDLVNEMLKKR